MKSLVRWSATAGLVGSALIGSFLAGTMQVLAIPQEQIIQKLGPIPVFTIANAQGSPLVSSPPNGKKGRAVAGVFISQKDAQNFLNSFKTENPDLAKNVKVVPLSLAEVYQLNQTNKDKPDQPIFGYVPARQQVESAVALLKQSGVKVDQFSVTPLFAIVSTKGKEKGFVGFQRGNQNSFPLFFEKEQSQVLLDRLKKQQSEFASNTQIEVLSLEDVLAKLQSSGNKDPKQEEFLSQIQLVPSKEAEEFIKSLSPQQGAPATGTNKPAAAPAPAPKK